MHENILQYTIELGYCVWSIDPKERTVSVNDYDGTEWTMEIATVCDYSDDDIYSDYLSYVGFEAERIPFELFAQLIIKTFRILGE